MVMDQLDFWSYLQTSNKSTESALLICHLGSIGLRVQCRYLKKGSDGKGHCICCIRSSALLFIFWLFGSLILSIFGFSFQKPFVECKCKWAFIPLYQINQPSSAALVCSSMHLQKKGFSSTLLPQLTKNQRNVFRKLHAFNSVWRMALS